MLSVAWRRGRVGGSKHCVETAVDAPDNVDFNASLFWRPFQRYLLGLPKTDMPLERNLLPKEGINAADTLLLRFQAFP